MAFSRTNVKPIAVILIIALVLNLVLFAFGKINQLWFWAVIIIIAIIAYIIMPRLRKPD